MLHIIHRHQISFKNAFAGLIWSLQTQPNFKIHAFLSLMAVLAGIYLQITRYEMLIILFTIILGFTVEMLNTSIEAITDLITKEWRQDAKIAKDVAAGMMLTVAIGAAVVALYIFMPYCLN